MKADVGAEAMSCKCVEYKPIELDRKSINRRIKESRAIKKALVVVAKNDQLQLLLLRCPQCNQLWQSGHEWNFAGQEYLFQVPFVEIESWLQEPYMQPAPMMIHDAAMRTFEERAKLEPSEEACRSPGCTAFSVKGSVLCHAHHIESLQEIRMLPQTPIGRMFAPYSYASPPQQSIQPDGPASGGFAG